MPSKTVLPTTEEALPGRTEPLTVEAKHTVNGNSTLEPFPAGLEWAMFGMGCFWGVEKLFWKQKGVFSTQVGYAGGFTKNPTYEEVCTATWTFHLANDWQLPLYSNGQTTVKMKVSLRHQNDCFNKRYSCTSLLDGLLALVGNLLLTYTRHFSILCSNTTRPGLTAHIEVVRIIFDPKVISYKTLLKLFWENHNPTEGMKQGQDIGTQYRSVIFTYGDKQKEAALQSKESFQKALKQGGLGAIATEILPVPEFYYAEDYHQQYLDKNPDGYCGLKGTGVTCVQ